MTRALLSTLLAAALAAAPAGADVLCHTVEVPLQPTGWTASAIVPGFDPEDGVLTGITLTLSGTAQGAAWLESLAGAPTSVTTSFGATITLSRPDGSPLLAVSPASGLVDDLAAFDGSVDFAGGSGATHLGLVAMGEASGPCADLELFTGDAGAPGVVELPLEALDASTAGGGQELIVQFQTSASAALTVCYAFEPDCNRNGVPDADDIAAGKSGDADGDGVPDECQPATRSLCEGDGAADGGLDCPCQNTGSPGGGCLNGLGGSALLSAAGVPSLSADTLTLTVSGLEPATPGFFLVGLEPANGGLGVFFGSGLRCVDHAVPLLQQGGGRVLPGAGAPALGELLGAQPGRSSCFQYWYRDPDGPCGGHPANTTNAIEVRWGL